MSGQRPAPQTSAARTTVRTATRVAALAVALLAFALPATSSAAEPAPAGEEATQVASLPPVRAPRSDTGLPRVLSDADADAYRRIFALQEDGDWPAADRIIATLDDDLLMGHVLAQRYLHPTAYRSRYAELRDWLDSYADHPQARRIHALAERRRPGGAPAPRRPRGGGYLSGNGYGDDLGGGSVYRPQKSLSADERRKAERLRRTVRRYQREGWTLSVKRLLRDSDVQALFDPVELDRLRATLGAGYYGDNRDEWALEWAGEAAERSGRYLPEAHWTAGLAAWRLGRYPLAAGHFKEVATSGYASRWLMSAGAFWAARAELKSRRPQEVTAWLGTAAAWPRTFYGQIAKRILGRRHAFDWDLPPLAEGPREASALGRLPGGRRALALVEAGRIEPAERELRSLYGSIGPDGLGQILSVAVRARMPGLALRLGGLLAREGRGRFDAAAYPVPAWEPSEGFQVDRALIYAIMRQESGFNPGAESYAGARGLMQIMPGTASWISGDRSFRGAKRRALFDPEVNVSLGQEYLEMLAREPGIDSDLFKMVAAWNGGPGNLAKWLRHVRHGDDPLLFIESIPSPETRAFVERVLTNLWIYRDRLGQPAPSLDAIAAGEWPVYTALDRHDLMVAENGED